MYPGLEKVEIKDHEELDSNFNECMNLLHINKYVCQPKMDYANERRGKYVKFSTHP